MISSGGLRWGGFALLVVIGYFVLAVSQLPRYGPTFDAVLGDYAYGELMLEAIRAGDIRWLEFEGKELPWWGEGDHPRWKTTYLSKWVYPVPALLSAASCLLFSRTLGWIDPVDAHHLIAPMAIALLLGLLYRFVAHRISPQVGLATVIVLILYPRLFGHSMNNIKDAPTLLIVTASLFAWVRVAERSRVRDVAIAALLTGIGFATKVNAIWPVAFFTVASTATALQRSIRGDEQGGGERRFFLGSLIVAPIVIAAAYVAVSPNLWVDGMTRFVSHARYALFEAVHVDNRDGFSIAPLRNFFFVTPPLYFPLALLGAFELVRRGTFHPTVRYMLLLTMIVPVVRPCFPGMRYFNIIRHFLEILPIWAIVVGTGSVALLRLVYTRLPLSNFGKQGAVVVVAMLLIAPEGVALWRIHPYQTTYFNAFAGGLAGRQDVRHPDACDYWCQSYREGIRWINANAPPNSVLLVPFAPWVVGAVRKAWLRDDISFTENDQVIAKMIATGLLASARDDRWSRVGPIYVMFVDQHPIPPPYSEISRYCRHELEPVYVERADGGIIFSVYHLHAPAEEQHDGG